MPTSPPDYFALLSSMTAPLQGTGSPGVPGFSPEEIDRKIGELETVLVWLKAQASAVELSIKTLELQRDTLRKWQSTQSTAKEAMKPEQLAAFSAAFHPALWALSQLTPFAAGKTEKSAVSTGSQQTARKRKKI